jgi:hypothetical protein
MWWRSTSDDDNGTTSPRSSRHRAWSQVPQLRVLLPEAMMRSHEHVIDFEMSVLEQA